MRAARATQASGAVGEVEAKSAIGPQRTTGVGRSRDRAGPHDRAVGGRRAVGTGEACGHSRVQHARPGHEALDREQHERGQRQVGVALERRVARLPLREELAVEGEQPLDLEEAVGARQHEAQAALPGRQLRVAAQEVAEGVEVERDALDAAAAGPLRTSRRAGTPSARWACGAGGAWPRARGRRWPAPGTKCTKPTSRRSRVVAEREHGVAVVGRVHVVERHREAALRLAAAATCG